jgi:hypothetical protein
VASSITGPPRRSTTSPVLIAAVAYSPLPWIGDRLTVACGVSQQRSG